MMKTFAKTLGFLLIVLLAVSCSKSEGLLATGDELSDAVLKGAKVIETPIDFSGYSNYKAIVPKTSSVLDAGGPECSGTLHHNDGQLYSLDLMEFMYIPIPDEPYLLRMERHLLLPLKITPGGVVSGYWPETWFDWGNPPEGGTPNTGVVSTITEHLGCDLHGPGINKGTINCNGTFDGNNLKFVFRFNGQDNGIPSTLGPDAIWDQIDGPAIFEFSFDMTVAE